jgi:hypothetical protein
VRAAATATLGPHLGSGEFQGVSTAVADLPVVVAPVVTTLNARDSEHLGAQQGSSNAQDPMIQKRRGTGPLSAPIVNFDGMCLPFGDKPCAEASSCSCLPLDTNGAVGTTQFVQMVSSDFAVYSKTGQVLRHATPIKQLWSTAGGECAVHNDGDPVVIYDQFANRWLLSQFVAQPVAGESYGECVAVSTTSDATGTYNLYFLDEAAANPVGGQYNGQLPGDADGSRFAADRGAERDRRSRRSEQRAADGHRRRLRHAPVAVPRRLVEPGELDLRQQRAAELHGAGCAVRTAAVRLWLWRLRGPEGRPAGTRCAWRSADVPGRIPQLR